MAKKAARRAGEIRGAAGETPRTSTGQDIGPFIWLNPGSFMRFIAAGSSFVIDGSVQYGRLPRRRNESGEYEWDVRADRVRVSLIWKQVMTSPQSATQLMNEAMAEIAYPSASTPSTDGYFTTTLTANMVSDQIGTSGPIIPNYYIQVQAEKLGQVVSYVWHTISLLPSGVIIPPLM